MPVGRWNGEGEDWPSDAKQMKSVALHTGGSIAGSFYRDFLFHLIILKYVDEIQHVV